jgi:hypothetical protein
VTCFSSSCSWINPGILAGFFRVFVRKLLSSSVKTDRNGFHRTPFPFLPSFLDLGPQHTRRPCGQQNQTIHALPFPPGWTLAEDLAKLMPALAIHKLLI